MRFCLWILIIAVTFWSIESNRLIDVAFANYVQTVRTGWATYTQTAQNGFVTIQTVPLFETRTVVSTLTGTYTDGNGPTMSTSSAGSTDTNCHNGGVNYSGAVANFCNRTDPTMQRNTQDDNKKNNDNGADQSSMLGMMAIAAGMALVAAGMALLPPPTTPIGVAMIAMGMALIAAGMAALAAASKMSNNADKSGVNAGNLDNLNDKFKSTISGDKGKPTDGTSQLGDVGKADLGDGNNSGIRIDPALTRTGKADGIFSDMEKKTGLNRDDMMKSLARGGNPLNLLANSPALSGKPSASEGNLQKMMDDTLAKGNIPSGQEIMDKLGITKDDLAGMGGGSSANRDLAGTPSIDALFPDQGKPTGPALDNGRGDMKLSPEVQAALDKHGITGRSIFDMVHAQYVKKTPIMFGVEVRKEGVSNSPYNGLNGDKMDL